jgi:hypothetical protein
MRSGLPVEFNPFTFAVENDTLYMTLPSGRRLAYPQAQLRPGKFEGTRVINCERGASEDLFARCRKTSTRWSSCS